MKIPSVLNDQWDDKNKLQDKFWGRVPKYLHIIPETIYTNDPIYMCNPEYIYLVEQYMLGKINESNLSQELYYDIEETVNRIPNYGRFPQPGYDPLFQCMGYIPSATPCAIMVDSNCKYIVTSDGCYLSPPAENIWDYQYFTDSDSSSYGVYVLDWRNMILIDHIATVGANPHSVDRACLTDRAIARTQNEHSFDVLDMRQREVIKTVPIPHKPRTSGGQNTFLNVQLIAGKDHPMISVIDVLLNEAVIGTYGPLTQPGQTPTGNGGGSATGHPAWLDSHHFYNIDRLNDLIRVYEVSETGNLPDRFSIREIQEVPTPVGAHIMSTEEKWYSYETKTFWMATEGSVSVGEPPRLYIYKWEARQLREVVDSNNDPIYGECPTTDDDVGHHYEVNFELNEVWFPTLKSGKCFVFDATTLALKYEFEAGAGAGHVSFSYRYKCGCITNHFDNIVTIREWDTGTVHQIVVNNFTLPPGELIQTHQNKILPHENIPYEEEDSGRYYFFGLAYEGGGGAFKRIDLKELRDGNVVIDTIDVIGHPEQSTS